MKKISWYYNENLKPQGPLTLEEMRARIHSGKIGLFDLISSDATGEWKAACEWPEFERSLFPAIQGFIPGAEILEDEKEWVLLVPSENGKTSLQEGPFSIRELKASLAAGTVSGNQYIWKTGLSGWCRLLDRPEFN
ncbi:DUF4339 domain-containing protein [Bdellovibrio sp. 22V]|uniref:DUF4339 domain-containing protein n=1 Tax=Bdellovibrio TaxID=958 RepID=UPI002542A970|nr:DUF4339 domain-containing protein [Bdellovibrio sp. 22V]WII71124.1 DUF4339 domain-containing protein [Bdellovibrio sp. 22V]